MINRLLELQDKQYADFQSKLIPTIAPARIIGIRTPYLRKLAKQIYKENLNFQQDTNTELYTFIIDLPHRYFDEDQLHAFIISEIKDFDTCIAEVDRFLPYIDNWATCDQLSPKCFNKHKEQLLPYINTWLASSHIYTIRFGIGMLMHHFLDNEFKPEYHIMVAKIESEEYYIQMMQAWYFATALAKQWDATIPYLERKAQGADKYKMPNDWVHNKTIQKAIESYRILQQQKMLLKSLKKS